MLKIKKKYVIDEKKRPFAVQVDIETFERIERLIEDYALGQFINENNSSDDMTLEEGKAYYQKSEDGGLRMEDCCRWMKWQSLIKP